MFSTHVTSVCFVRSGRDALEETILWHLSHMILGSSGPLSSAPLHQSHPQRTLTELLVAPLNKLAGWMSERRTCRLICLGVLRKSQVSVNFSVKQMDALSFAIWIKHTHTHTTYVSWYVMAEASVLAHMVCSLTCQQSFIHQFKVKPSAIDSKGRLQLV